MANSIWDRPELASAPEYELNNPFLMKAIAPGTTMQLKFVDVLAKTRQEDFGKQKAGDTFQMFCFVDTNGKERSIDQNSSKGAFWKEAVRVKLEPGENFLLTRTGEKVETSWQIQKLGADGLPVPEYVPQNNF